MMSFGSITDADLDVAVHADPSNDPVLWQQGAETIEEYFGPGGTFWSEPITSNGEYVSEGSMSMSISSGSSHGSGGGNGIAMCASSDNDMNFNVGTSSVIGGAMNGLNIDCGGDYSPTHTAIVDENYYPHRFSAPQAGFYQQQNATYDSSPPATQQTKHGPRKRPSPTVDIKQPTQSEKMHAELSYPITPQLGTPYVRGRTTRSTKGAEKMRREMEGQEVVDTPVKSSSNDPKRKKGAQTPVKSSSNDSKRKKEAGTPVGPRKQPKRAAKNKK
jgi:hypothetical protein